MIPERSSASATHNGLDITMQWLAHAFKMIVCLVSERRGVVWSRDLDAGHYQDLVLQGTGDCASWTMRVASNL